MWNPIGRLFRPAAPEVVPLQDLLRRHEVLLTEQLRVFYKILRHQEKIMDKLDAILADVTDETTQIDSVLTLVQGLKDQLAGVLAGTVLPPGTQAKIDAIFSGVEANKAKLGVALSANVQPTDQPAAQPAVNTGG